jgi:hypothetical protein
MTFVSGEKFMGTFADDRAEGEGIFYKKSGDIIKGIWSKNRLVEG